MAKIAASIGLTLKIGGPQSMEYIRVGCEIQDIDTDLPVDTQLSEVRDTYHAVLEECEKIIDEKLDDMISKKILTGPDAK